MQKENWTEWLKGFYYFLGAFVPSVSALYLLGTKWIASQEVKWKERSVGESKVKHLESEIDSLRKECDSGKSERHDLRREIERLKDGQDKIAEELRRNLQESINILMRGK